jgi:hypothetical protein
MEGAYFRLESSSPAQKLSFEMLHARLIRFIHQRVQNGEFTERGLARILGISQPQIHNVLKGARKMRPELADRVIRKFNMSVLDLLEPAEIYTEMLSRGTIQVDPVEVAENPKPARFSPGRERRKPSQQLQTQTAKPRTAQA